MRFIDPDQIICPCSSVSFERITFLCEDAISLVCSDCGAELVAFVGDDLEVECRPLDSYVDDLEVEQW